MIERESEPCCRFGLAGQQPSLHALDRQGFQKEVNDHVVDNISGSDRIVAARHVDRLLDGRDHPHSACIVPHQCGSAPGDAPPAHMKSPLQLRKALEFPRHASR